MGCIYKITNKLDGKSYVGQTHRDPAIHWRNYRYGATHHKKYNKRGRAILDAIVSVGIDNFEFEIIEECDDNCLNDRERHWIAALNTNLCAGGHGYNLTSGGQDRHTQKAQVHHKHTNATKEKIRIAHAGRDHIGWRKAPYTEKERQNKSHAADSQKTRIERWSTDGTFLELHDSQSAAHRWLQAQGLVTEKTRVLTIKHGEVKLYRGYYWRRSGDATAVPTVPTHKHWRAIEQMTLAGDTICVFSSIKHAVIALKKAGIKAHKDTINVALQSASKEAYGFKWQDARFS